MARVATAHTNVATIEISLCMPHVRPENKTIQQINAQIKNVKKTGNAPTSVWPECVVWSMLLRELLLADAETGTANAIDATKIAENPFDLPLFIHIALRRYEGGGIGPTSSSRQRLGQDPQRLYLINIWKHFLTKPWGYLRVAIKSFLFSTKSSSWIILPATDKIK